MKNYYALLIAVALVGCGAEKASFETQEQARQQVLENATFNAKAWRDANAPDAKIMMRGDSTISPACITGDGWVTVDLMGAGVQLKCSSVSGTIGCMKVADFKARPDYSNQDGNCNKDLPFPLPKILK